MCPVMRACSRYWENRCLQQQYGDNLNTGIHRSYGKHSWRRKSINLYWHLHVPCPELSECAWEASSTIGVIVSFNEVSSPFKSFLHTGQVPCWKGNQHSILQWMKLHLVTTSWFSIDVLFVRPSKMTLFLTKCGNLRYVIT